METDGKGWKDEERKQDENKMKTYETRFWMLLVNLCRSQEDGFDTYAKVKEAVDEEHSLGQTSTNILLKGA